MKNFASGEIFVTRATDRPAKKHLLVKVQVPMSDMPGPLQVYNKERTCFGMVPADQHRSKHETVCCREGLRVLSKINSSSRGHGNTGIGSAIRE